MRIIHPSLWKQKLSLYVKSKFTEFVTNLYRLTLHHEFKS